MTARNKQRGNEFEREVVKLAQAYDLQAKRAWGSNGESCGWSADVDVEIDNDHFQLKRRKKIADFLSIPDSCVGVIFKQDRSKPLILLSLAEYLTLKHFLKERTKD